MTDKPDAVAELVERLNATIPESDGPNGIWQVLRNPDGPEAADTLTTLSRRNAELEAERTELRQLLHDVRLEASETIPPDGKAAAFAALHRICLMISTRAALGGSTDV